jgi:2-keto-4-pentenoate hydratase/2-oxohepta-3-ene-1,7-dioic acid hydratase in catechol pathway
MKFARYRQDGVFRIGIVEQDGAAIREMTPAVSDILELIDRYDVLRSQIRPVGDRMILEELELDAPIPKPRRNIFCVGKNYREHATEFSQSGYEAGAAKGSGIDDYPAVFTKPASTVVGPRAPVSLHRGITEEVDYEVELALVIGRGGRNIAREEAYQHIWGYTIINDVTARDRQKRHKQWFLGKSLDTFCPMGPWITTADEVDPENLELETRVNGELRQRGNTRDLIFGIPEVIETISAGLTLAPGDIIATGTPAGVGIGFSPPRFLQEGDTVEMTITGLGLLSNTFE